MINTLVSLLEHKIKLQINRRRFLSDIFINNSYGIDINEIITLGPTEAGIPESEIEIIIKKCLLSGMDNLTKFGKNLIWRTFEEELIVFVQKYMYLCGWKTDIINEIGKVDKDTKKVIILCVGLFLNVKEVHEILRSSIDFNSSIWDVITEKTNRKLVEKKVFDFLKKAGTVGAYFVLPDSLVTVILVGVSTIGTANSFYKINRTVNTNISKIYESNVFQSEMKSPSLYKDIYDSYSDKNKKMFLNLAKAHKEKIQLNEQQFLENFAKISEYFKNTIRMNSVLFHLGYVAYKFMYYMIDEIGEKYSSQLKDDDFYERLKRTTNNADEFYIQNTDLDEVTVYTQLEVIAKNLFTLIKNENNIKKIKDKKINWERPTYSYKEWLTFLSFIKKNKELTARKRKIISDYDEKIVNYECVRDTYIYTVILLLFIKNKNEREKTDLYEVGYGK